MGSCKDKIRDFFENHSYKMMIVSISIQSALFVAFIITFFLVTESEWAYNVFISVSMTIFLGFMIQFAIHSVSTIFIIY
jgi:hypothetical protein